MTVRTALLQGTKLLEDAVVPVPRLTAEVLLSYAMRHDRVWLYAHSDQQLTDLEWLHYGRYLHERMRGKPTQYITKQQEFYGRPFHVTPDVLIPRPETEHVVETALAVGRDARRILDVGCGSGALAVTLQLETGACVYATDVSLAAIAVAADNARRLGAAVCFVACDLCSAIAGHSVDLLVCNPPYVPLSDAPTLQREVRDYEPHLALFGGPSGLEIYERLAEDSPRVLRPGGRVVLELGFGTYDRVVAMFQAGWCNVQTVPDLAGIPRVLTAQLS